MRVGYTGGGSDPGRGEREQRDVQQAADDRRLSPLDRPGGVSVGLAAGEHAQPAVAHGAAPGPGLLGGVVPAAPRRAASGCSTTTSARRAARRLPEPGRGLRLRRCIDGQPARRSCRCPTSVTVSGSTRSSTSAPTRFVAAGRDVRHQPGLYLLAPAAGTATYPTGSPRCSASTPGSRSCIPRVFMDDTDEDRAAIQPWSTRSMMYPLADYTGRCRRTDWANAPRFPAGRCTGGEQKRSGLIPGSSSTTAEGPRRGAGPPGRGGLYGWFERAEPRHARSADRRAAHADAADARRTDRPICSSSATSASRSPHTGRPSATEPSSAPTTCRATASRRPNIFVNTPDRDHVLLPGPRQRRRALNGATLHGDVPRRSLPPVDGFWSLTLYNEHHFFQPTTSTATRSAPRTRPCTTATTAHSP